MSIPAPINVQPSGQVLGNDGFWQTFAIRVGTPAQTLQLVPSTLIAETMVVNLAGCTDSGFSNCEELRGGLFDNTSSTTWSPLGGDSEYSLSIVLDLGISGSDGGYYGYDTVGLTATDGASIVVNRMVVSDYSTTDFFVGMLGLSQKPSAIIGNNQTSFLKTLYDEIQIPSLGYSYTAGATYRNSPPSLTLGGQDVSLIHPNSVNLTMAPSGDRDLVVGLQAITMEVDGTSLQLLTDGIEVGIDSTQPYLWLPQTACDAFAKQFGLEQDEITTRYTLNASSHEANIKVNATLVFQVGNSVQGGETVNITFPYSAFDLNYTDEAVTDPVTKYMFPIRAQSDTQAFTLGRGFLQEAYLSVNYEFNNFSLYQAIPQEKDHQAHIVPLASLSALPTTSTVPGGNAANNSPGSGSGISGGAIAGIVIGVLAVIVLALILWFCYRPRQKHRRDSKHGGHVETFHSAPDSGLPPELEQERLGPEMAHQPLDYFAYNPKNAAAFHQKPFVAPVVSSDSSQRGELDSNQGYSSGMSSPHDLMSAYHDTAQELAGEAASPVELPTRNTSVKGTSRTSRTPPESFGIAPQGPITRDVSSWGDGTHLEEASIASESRPSMMSAQSVTFMYSGSPSLISHSRNGHSTSRVQSYGSEVSAMPLLPAHSAGPSMDEQSILEATQLAYSRNIQNPRSPTNPILPVLQTAGDNNNRSQDTLVGSQGGHSPTMERHAEAEEEPSSPVDAFMHDSPEHASLGYRGAWERPPRSNTSRDS